LTDGSRILGLGDQGWDGLGISIGKLALYVAAAGIHPRATIPICVDLGTNNKEKLDDPLYLGLRRERAGDDEYGPFMDEVMDALNAKYPNLIVQFEDFSTERAFHFLERYQKTRRVFNDDIQGTGAVVLGGFTNAARVSSKASGRPLHDQRILFFGAGSAGVGVAVQLKSFFTRQGISDDEARERIWLCDSKGLVTKDRGDKLPAHKVHFAREDNNGTQCKTLLEAVEYIKPTAIIGLSTVPDTFTKDVLKRMAELNKRPIVFPLSNPSHLSECNYETAINATNGTAIFASGSPFAELDYEGKHYIPGQGNNLYVFPGIGLAGALCKAGQITDEMVTEAALALADSLTEEEKAEGRIYPALTRMREISRDVACRVIKMAIQQGHARDGGYTASMDEEELRDWVANEMWHPTYNKVTA
jgi:malate dehydrogenase (oxaloacetate-decarboxylating)(NADP+)